MKPQFYVIRRLDKGHVGEYACSLSEWSKDLQDARIYILQSILFTALEYYRLKEQIPVTFERVK